MPEPPIPDEEIVFRRIPPGEHWFEPPDRFTSANFKLRDNESGLSVFRKSRITDAGVLSRIDSIPGSFVVWTSVGEIRGAKNGKGDPLGLDVVVPEGETDFAHAEIRGRFTAAASNALKHLFRR